MQTMPFEREMLAGRHATKGPGMAGLAVSETQRALALYGPAILRQKYYDPAARPPKELPRLQAAAGPHKTSTDPHAGGLALDIILFAGVPEEKALADRIVEVFLSLRVEMGWNAVIYNGREWNRLGKEFPRTGTKENRHLSHIHIQWPATTVENASFSFLLMYSLYEAFQSTARS